VGDPFCPLVCQTVKVLLHLLAAGAAQQQPAPQEQLWRLVYY
jgi:hypothetical protein